MKRKKINPDDVAFDSPKKSYTSVDKTTRDALARISHQLMRENDWTYVQVHALFNASDCPMGLSTIKRYVKAVDESGSPFKEKNNSSGKVKVTYALLMVLAGYVFSKNDLHEQVTVSMVNQFLRDRTGIKVSDDHLRVLLKDCGISAKSTTRRTAGYKYSNEQILELMVAFVGDLQSIMYTHFVDKNGVLRVSRNIRDDRICCIDCTFTSHRTDKPKTLQLEGTKNMKLKEALSRFTNCIVTCVWADGVNRTPSMLFTVNNRFVEEQKKTDRGDRIAKERKSCFKETGIEEDRVVFVDDIVRSKSYVPEKSEITEMYFEHYAKKSGQFSDWQKCIIISDGGAAYKVGKESILEQIGFRKHLTLPAAAHHLLSPNDNSLHGAAKGKWKNMNLNFKDDVKSSLWLLKLLDDDTKAHSKMYFQRNMLFGSTGVDADKLKEVISTVDDSGEKFMEKCRRAHKKFMKKQPLFT